MWSTANSTHWSMPPTSSKLSAKAGAADVAVFALGNKAAFREFAARHIPLVLRLRGGRRPGQSHPVAQRPSGPWLPRAQADSLSAWPPTTSPNHVTKLLVIIVLADRAVLLSHCSNTPACSTSKKQHCHLAEPPRPRFSKLPAVFSLKFSSQNHDTKSFSDANQLGNTAAAKTFCGSCRPTRASSLGSASTKEKVHQQSLEEAD